MDVDREIGNSAENCDETDYETDEEALGKISRKLSNNFPLLHYRNPKLRTILITFAWFPRLSSVFQFM